MARRPVKRRTRRRRFMQKRVKRSRPALRKRRKTYAKIANSNTAIARAFTRGAGARSQKTGDRFKMSESRYKTILKSTSIGVISTQKGGTGLPMLMSVRQTWGDDDLSLGNGSLGVTGYAFRVNSTFDCDFTGGVAQPKGRDLLATLYTHYAVIKCRYTIVFRNLGTSPHYCHVVADTRQPHQFNSLDEIREEPSTSSTLLSGVNENDGQERGVMTGWVDMRDHIQPSIGNFRDNHLALIGANAPEDVYLHVLLSGETNAAIPPTGSVLFSIQLQYFVVYSSHTDVDMQS